MSNCLECEEYNHEKHYCPKFCDVIREAVKDIRKDSIPIEWMLNEWDSKEYADVGYQVMRRIIADWAEREEE